MYVLAMSLSAWWLKKLPTAHPPQHPQNCQRAIMESSWNARISIRAHYNSFRMHIRIVFECPGLSLCDKTPAWTRTPYLPRFLCEFDRNLRFTLPPSNISLCRQIGAAHLDSLARAPAVLVTGGTPIFLSLEYGE